jgi:hypothetical protein
MSRRSKKLIDAEVQSALIRRLCFHWCLFMVANVLAMAMWVKFFEAPAEDWNAYVRLCIERLLPLTLVSIAILPAFLRDTIKLTNRFAGPITRLRRTLAQIADGQTPKSLEFRDSDFWRSMANDLNRALSRIPAPRTEAVTTKHEDAIRAT